MDYKPLLICIIVSLLLLLRYIKKESFDPGTKIDDIPIYVINLDHRKDRRDRLVEAFKNASISNYKITKAVNGADLNVDKLREEGIAKGETLKRGWYGCTLSHINIWKDLLDSEYKYAMVLEDDVIIPSDFNERMNRLIATIENLDFDLLYISSNCYDQNNCKKGEYVTNEVYNPKVPDVIAGTQAMVVNKKAIPRLLENVIPITFAFDRVLMDLSKPSIENGIEIPPKIKTYILKDNLVNVNDYGDSETERII